MKSILRTALLVFLTAATARAESERIVRGQVLDADARPVAGVDVTYMWRANGSPRDENDQPYDLTAIAGQKAFWGNVGKMFPWGRAPVKTGADGRFSISVPDSRHHLMVMDRARRRGAVAILPEAAATEIKISMAPLIRVIGKLEGPGTGEIPEWCHVYTLVPDDPTRPLDSTRLVSCGSFEGRFEMLLPPGR